VRAARVRLLVGLLALSGCREDDSAVELDAAVELGPCGSPGPSGCLSGPCSLLDQTGCPEGYACDLIGSDLETSEPQCRPIHVAGQQGDACADLTECGAGLFCIASGRDGNTCLHYCDSDDDCSGGPGALCIQQAYAITSADGGASDADGGVASFPGVSLCSTSCDPISAKGCPPDWGCRIAWYVGGQPRPDLFTLCSPRGGGKQGTGCTVTDDCAPGYYCAAVSNGGSSAKTCVKSCVVGDDSTCSPLLDAKCYPFDMPQMLGQTSYGVCVIS
jgi:hypothetical protein